MKPLYISASLRSEAAKALRRSLSSHGTTISLGKAQEALARVLGFESAYALQHAPPAHPRDPLDHELPPALLKERQAVQASRLGDFLNISQSDALAVVQEASPSGYRRKSGSLANSPKLPEELVASLSGSLKNAVFARMKFPLEILVERQLLRLLASREGRKIEKGRSLTVDAYLSNELPQIVETRRILDPKALDLGFGSDVVQEWKRRGPDISGWEAIRNQVRGAYEHALSVLDPKHWSRENAAIREQIATCWNCTEDEVPVRLKSSGTIHAIADEAWKELRAKFGPRLLMDVVIKRRNQHGFYAWRPGIENENTVEAEYWRPLSRASWPSEIKKDFRKIEFVIAEAQVTIEITRERSHFDYEGSPLAFYFFVAKAHVRDRVVGLVRGELILQTNRNEFVANETFYYACESLSGDLTHLAHIITTQHIEAWLLFEAGDLLYLTHWEVVPEFAGTGFAGSFLVGVLKELKRRHKRLASIAYELHPAQFPHPFDRSLPIPVVQAYDNSRGRLARHLDELQINHQAGFHGHMIAFDVTPEQEALTDNQRYHIHLRNSREYMT